MYSRAAMYRKKEERRSVGRPVGSTKVPKLKQIFKQKTYGSGRLGIPRGTYKKRIKNDDSEFDHPMSKPMIHHHKPLIRP
jgi:hypothetical protein